MQSHCADYYRALHNDYHIAIGIVDYYILCIILITTRNLIAFSKLKESLNSNVKYL